MQYYILKLEPKVFHSKIGELEIVFTHLVTRILDCIVVKFVYHQPVLIILIIHIFLCTIIISIALETHIEMHVL